MSHSGGRGSVPCYPSTAVCLVGKKKKKWHWNKLFSEYFGFPLSALFYQCIHSAWTHFKSEFKTKKVYTYIQK